MGKEGNKSWCNTIGTFGLSTKATYNCAQSLAFDLLSKIENEYYKSVEILANSASP